MRRPLLRKPYTGLRHLEDEHRRPGAVPRDESTMPDPPPRRLWTPEEDALVRAALAGGAQHGEIAHMLGRTTGAVTGHIVYLRRVGRL